MTILNLIAAGDSVFGTGLTPSNEITSGLANLDTSKPFTTVELLVSQVMGFLTLLGGLVFIVMFINGAFKWISGGEDAAKISKARDLMVQAVIGLIVMVGGYAVIGLVGEIIGFDILNPAANLNTIFGLTGSGY